MLQEILELIRMGLIVVLLTDQTFSSTQARWAARASSQHHHQWHLASLATRPTISHQITSQMPNLHQAAIPTTPTVCQAVAILPLYSLVYRHTCPAQIINMAIKATPATSLLHHSKARTPFPTRIRTRCIKVLLSPPPTTTKLHPLTRIKTVLGTRTKRDRHTLVSPLPTILGTANLIAPLTNQVLANQGHPTSLQAANLVAHLTKGTTNRANQDMALINLMDLLAIRTACRARPFQQISWVTVLEKCQLRNRHWTVISLLRR